MIYACDKPLPLTLQKNLLQKLTGLHLRYPKLSEKYIWKHHNKDSSPICPHYSTVKMYHELHYFFIIIIIFSSIVCFLQPSYATVNWLIKKIHVECTEKLERKLNSEMHITILAKKVESHKKLLLQPVNLAKCLAEG